MGSVKDLNILKYPTLKELGVGRFKFSDRYSVFDWGEMPNQIKNKGAAITLLAGYFFEKLEEKGYKTHYRGLVQNNKVLKINEITSPVCEMEVDLLNVVKPELREDTYNYDKYKNINYNHLIPLEIIYRNALPEGSSVFKRLSRGNIDYKDLGLEKKPFPGMDLKKPILDVSTKLEITDRYVKWDEAKKIANLNNEELEKIKSITTEIDCFISNNFKKINLINQDGKIELGLDNHRNIVIVDVVGTLDECRFTYNDIAVSKEIARIFYRKSDWYKDIEKAKKIDRQNWKKICNSYPNPLPDRFAELISMVYCKITNEITGREFFKVNLSLDDIMKEIHTFIA